MTLQRRLLLRASYQGAGAPKNCIPTQERGNDQIKWENNIMLRYQCSAAFG